eukprot:1210775-Alexandrium_andersonii.AAC.1
MSPRRGRREWPTHEEARGRRAGPLGQAREEVRKRRGAAVLEAEPPLQATRGDLKKLWGQTTEADH